MTNVRGNAFYAINRWLSSRLNSEGYQVFLSRMREPVSRVLSSGEGWYWYPLEYLTEVFEGITSYLGDGNGKVLEHLGMGLADEDAGGTSLTRLALLPMPRVVARIPYVWSKCRDAGEFRVVAVDEEERQAVIELRGYEGTRVHCCVNRAWLERMCRLMSGIKVQVAERACRHIEGGEACLWEISWK